MWDYFDDIKRRIRELEDEISKIIELYPKDDLDEACIEPLTTINETPEFVIVTIDMPYLNQETIEVKLVDEHNLFVKAEICKGIKSSKIDSTYPDIEFKRYKCIVTLPSKVKKIYKISVRNDILTIYLAKLHQ